MFTGSAKQVTDFFSRQGWAVFEFQQKAWQAYLNRQSGLIHSPTGTGKTLAAWLGPVIEYLKSEPDLTKTPPLHVLWVTPLRALAADTETNLKQVSDALSLPWSIERRTGDTRSSQRARQRTRLPTAKSVLCFGRHVRH